MTTKSKQRKPARKPTAQHPAEAQLQSQYQVSARALDTVREQAAEIKRLAAEIERLKAAATVDIDAMIGDVLNHDRSLNMFAGQHVLVIQRNSSQTHATLCVASGTHAMPYRSARHFGDTIAEAVIALVHNIDPKADVTGMCNGLRALCGASA